eukprot:UN03466
MDSLFYVAPRSSWSTIFNFLLMYTKDSSPSSCTLKIQIYEKLICILKSSLFRSQFERYIPRPPYAGDIMSDLAETCLPRTLQLVKIHNKLLDTLLSNDDIKISKN